MTHSIQEDKNLDRVLGELKQNSVCVQVVLEVVLEVLYLSEGNSERHTDLTWMSPCL